METYDIQSLRYEVRNCESKKGNAPESSIPIVMLHGWGRSHRDLLPLADLLSHWFTCYTVDLPGFGDSPLPPSDWGTRDYAACVLEFCRDLGLQQFIVLGHSFGGRIALRLAAEEGGPVAKSPVAKMVLIGSHGLQLRKSATARARSRVINQMGAMCKRADTFFGSQLFEQHFVPRFGSADYRNAGALRGTLVKTVTEDQSDQLTSIEAPTLLLWGEHDTETPLAIAHRMHEHIAHSTLTVLPNRGHYPFHGISSHLCAYYIRNFIHGHFVLDGQSYGAAR